MERVNPLKVHKDKVDVVILTRGYRVEGEIYMMGHMRFTDFINVQPDKDFIPVTNAKVSQISQPKDIVTTKYLALNRHEITMIYPIQS